MPESKGRARPKQREDRRGKAPRDIAAKPSINPTWWVPVMCALMIVGVLWVATFYVTSAADPVFPLPIGYWNLVIGLGMIMAGFMMTTRWR